MPDEFRLAIGSPRGRRSTVWKFTAGGDGSIYIISRMFGGDTKVSLHASGECQFSGTSAWVLKEPGRRNADRHFFKWTHRRPIGTEALDALQIRIPYGELRVVDIEEDFRDVTWIPAPAPGNLIGIECYITPQTAIDPTVTGGLPGKHLCSIQLSDKCWFVVIQFEEPYDHQTIEETKRQMREIAAEEGREPMPSHRGCAIVTGHPTAVALMEFCPAQDNELTSDVSVTRGNMTSEQEKLHNSVAHIYDSYGMGVTWWQIIDYLTGIGSLFCGLVAASLAKYSTDHNDCVAILALIAALLAGIQKQLTPRNRLRMDWKGRSEMYRLRAELDADPNFDPIKAAVAMNKIIKAHDDRFIP